MPEHDLGIMYGFFGWKGAGKSLSATKFIYEEWYKGNQHPLNDGTRGVIDIYHNGGLMFGEKFNLRKFINMEYSNCMIFIDEFHIYANPRRAMSFMNVIMSDNMLQLRKMNVNMCIATHHMGLVDVNIRQQIDYHIQCEKPEEQELHGKVCYQEWSDPFGHYGPPGERTIPIVQWGLEEYWSFYDSFGLFFLDQVYDKKQQERERKAERFKEILGACQVLYDQGITEARPQMIVEVMNQNGIMDVSATDIGLALRNMGYASLKRPSGHFYSLQEVCAESNLAPPNIHTGPLSDRHGNGANYTVNPETGEILDTKIAQTSRTIAQGSHVPASDELEKLAYATIQENFSYRVVSQAWENRGYDTDILDSMIARRGMVLVKKGREMILRKAS